MVYAVAPEASLNELEDGRSSQVSLCMVLCIGR